MKQTETIRNDVGMSWENQKLSAVAEILMGQSPKGNSYNIDGVGLPLLNGAADYKGNKFSPKKYTNSPTKIARKGDILLGIRATIGNLSIADNEYCIGRGLAAIRVDEKRVNRGFVVHYISEQITKLISDASGSTIKGIVKEDLFDLQIPLPPLPTQKRIAEILDAADALRHKDQELLKKYDELAQAIFIDMFGDPVKNEKGWEVKKLGEIIHEGKNKIRSGPFGSDLLHSEFVEEGIRVLGIDNVVKNRFSIAKDRFVTQEKFNQLSRYEVFKDDVLISVMGTVGRSAIVPEYLGKAINSKHLITITVNKEIYNPYFLSFSFIHNQDIKFQIKRKSKGAIMDGLNIGIIKDLNIMIPPIDQQNKFVKRINSVNNQIDILNFQKSDDLFQSLLQKAFNGELVN